MRVEGYLNAALAYSRSAESIAQVHRTQRGISGSDACTGSARLGEDMLHKALAAARSPHDARVMMHCHLQLAALAFLQGKRPKALAHLRHHLAFVQPLHLAPPASPSASARGLKTTSKTGDDVSGNPAEQRLCLECGAHCVAPVVCQGCGVACYCSARHQAAARCRILGHAAVCLLYKNCHALGTDGKGHKGGPAQVRGTPEDGADAYDSELLVFLRQLTRLLPVPPSMPCPAAARSVPKASWRALRA